MRKIFSTIFILVFSIVTIAGQEYRIETNESKKWLNASQYVSIIIKELYDISYEKIMEKYGEPESVKIMEITNQYSEVKDLLFTISYKTHEIKILRINHLNTWLFNSIKINRKGVYQVFGIDIGSKESEIIKVFGKNYKEINDIRIEIKNEIVKEIEIFALE